MKKIGMLLCIFCALLFSGCASSQIRGPKPIGKVGYLEIAMCPSPEGLRVFDVGKGSPAEKAGVRDGDTIVRFNGRDLAALRNRKDLFWAVRAARKLTLTLKRDDQTLELPVTPGMRDRYEMDSLLEAIHDEILTGEKVAVAIVVGEINHASPVAYQDNNIGALSAWKAGKKAQVESDIENFFSAPYLRHCGNYSVVDRNKTSEILTELRFQMTGAVSTDMMKSIGKMTGASHLVFVSCTRYGNQHAGFTDETNTRLVEIESGNVLASVRFTQEVPR